MKENMKYPKIESKYNIVLSVSAREKLVLDKSGNILDDKRFDTFMNLVQISGIEAVFYCVFLKDELNVITMYYPTGKKFFTESFVRKYLAGMGTKFIEPSVSGARSYFQTE
jgi:hypothetical protein